MFCSAHVAGRTTVITGTGVLCRRGGSSHGQEEGARQGNSAVYFRRGTESNIYTDLERSDSMNVAKDSTNEWFSI